MRPLILSHVADYLELDASLSAALPRGGRALAARFGAGSPHGELQDVLLSGDQVHRGDRVPESPDNSVEDRQQSVRQGLPGLRVRRVRVRQRYRKRWDAESGQETGYDGRECRWSCRPVVQLQRDAGPDADPGWYHRRDVSGASSVLRRDRRIWSLDALSEPPWTAVGAHQRGPLSDAYATASASFGPFSLRAAITDHHHVVSLSLIDFYVGDLMFEEQSGI